MVTDPSVLFGSYDWFKNTRSIDVSIQVLGFWWWWLFIVPSLRSRRPKGFEKKALDIAFLGTPAISLLAPVATKDTSAIWIANFVVVAGAYAYAFVTYDEDNKSDDGSKDPEWLKFVYKSLDFGSGRERGARK
jgi:heme/copper-type cytochrome/quinol oxidase subunit 2